MLGACIDGLAFEKEGKIEIAFYASMKRFYAAIA